jgi:hypothetical protein
MVRSVSQDWQLWGTFSVADHRRMQAFVADVLVYDRLLIPVPVDEDVERWESRDWRPDQQRQIIDVLKEGDPHRVEEVPWTSWWETEFAERKEEFAAGVAGEVSEIQDAKRANPNTFGQYVERRILADYRNPARDIAILQGVPPINVDVVAAYGSIDDFIREFDAVEITEIRGRPDQLLGGFVWSFAVPAESDRSDLDLLKRAVDFANQPEVRGYRMAFHRWRRDMLISGFTADRASEQLRHDINAYASWVRRRRVTTRARGAYLVAGITAGIAAAIMPLVGLDIAGAAVGAGAAAVPVVGPVTARLFRGSRPPVAPSNSPAALFWEAQRAMILRMHSYVVDHPVCVCVFRI